MSDPLTLITERLYREFPALPLAQVIELVRQCRDDIDTGAPADCIPELVERLARTRLTLSLHDDRLPGVQAQPEPSRHAARLPDPPATQIDQQAPTLESAPYQV